MLNQIDTWGHHALEFSINIHILFMYIGTLKKKDLSTVQVLETENKSIKKTLNTKVKTHQNNFIK